MPVAVNMKLQRPFGRCTVNDLAPIGHNNPPDPLDTIPAQFETSRVEAESWLDGKLVETEGQMKAVDALREDMRRCRLDLVAAQDEAVRPLREATDAERDRWKPTIADTKIIEDGLVELVGDFKRKLAAEKERAEAAARAEARKAQEAAQRAAREADAANIEQQRAAQEAAHAAREAQAKAQAASKDKVKGLKETWHFEVTDFSVLLRWMNSNVRDDLETFAEEFARKNHRKTDLPGVRSWTTKEPY